MSIDYRFDRDWKKIEAFVGSKTVIQVIKESVLTYTSDSIMRIVWNHILNSNFMSSVLEFPYLLELNI